MFLFIRTSRSQRAMECWVSEWPLSHRHRGEQPVAVEWEWESVNVWLPSFFLPLYLGHGCAYQLQFSSVGFCIIFFSCLGSISNLRWDAGSMFLCSPFSPAGLVPFPTPTYMSIPHAMFWFPSVLLALCVAAVSFGWILLDFILSANLLRAKVYWQIMQIRTDKKRMTKHKWWLVFCASFQAKAGGQ